jgi:hypothetical protein
VVQAPATSHASPQELREREQRFQSRLDEIKRRHTAREEVNV